MIAPIYWAIELVAAVAKDRASRGLKRWQPEEIVDAICFMVTNAAVSGELWADAGWRPAT
jgi:urease gamma subunit